MVINLTKETALSELNGRKDSCSWPQKFGMKKKGFVVVAIVDDATKFNETNLNQT